MDQSLTVADALFGKTRQAVLGLLYGNPDRSYYLREIERLTAAGVGPTQRELSLLARAGLVTRRRVGNQVHYRANSASPVFPEVRSLVLKTVGAAVVLRQALEPLSPKIQLALVYGSVARGEETAASDVDVLIVGDVAFGEAVSALVPCQATLGREVNPTVYAWPEFAAKAREGHPFVRNVLAGSRIMLIGVDDDLTGLARECGIRGASGLED